MDQGRGRERPDLTEPASAPARGSQRFPIPLGTPLVWHAVSLVAGAVFLMYVNRGQWFFGDEWDFLTDRTVTIGHDGVFDPHNEHWSTAPILLYGLVFRLFGLSSYAPYVALVVAAHLVAVHLAWRVMLRGGVGPWIAAAMCAAFIPFGPGAENLLWAFQIGFVGSVACGLGAILLADHDQPFGRRDVSVWGLSILGLMFSGISIPLVGAAAVVAWMRRGLRAGLLTAAVPVAAYLLWLGAVGREGLAGTEPVTVDSLRVFPQFLWISVRETLSLGTSTPLAGAVPLLLSGIALFLRRRRSQELPHAAIALAVGEVLLLLMLAIGRAPLGLAAAEATRYVHIGGVLLLPLMVVGISDLVRPRAAAIVAVAALTLSWSFHNGRLLIQEADVEADRERLIREQIVAAGTHLDSGPQLRTRPEPVFSPDLDLSELVLLPSFPDDIVPSREAVARLALALQVSLTMSPESPSTIPVSSFRATDASLRPRADGCALLTPIASDPRLLIPVGTPSSYEVTVTFPGDLEVALAEAADYRDRLAVEAGDTAAVNLAVDLLPEQTLIVRVPGRAVVCPV